MLLWFNNVYNRAAKPTAWRVGIDTNDFTNPCLFFKQRTNTRAKFSTDAGDNNSATAH